MNLVTGGAGHLGNVLVRELIYRGEAVRVLVLPGEDTRSLAGLNVELVEGDVMDFDSLVRAMQMWMWFFIWLLWCRSQRIKPIYWRKSMLKAPGM